HAVQKELEDILGEAETARLDWRPMVTVNVGEDQAESLMNLLNALDDNDDVQRVAANYELSDEIMARLGG
ncbi:MAG: YebC/PmpR family DNA-binding transcriptional regulator, partial [Rhodospirillaceae bacterium]